MASAQSSEVTSESFVHTAVHAAGFDLADTRIALRPPLEHQSNRLYDIWVDDCPQRRHYIGKEYLLPDELLDAPRREYRTLLLLAAHDIAPRPIFYDPALGPIVIYEYMEGAMWDRQTPSATRLAQLAELWQTMGTVSTENLWMSRGYDRPIQEHEARFRTLFQGYAEWARQHFPAAERAAELCLERLASRGPQIRDLTEAVPVNRFGRADPRFANVIQRADGRVGMIDWEDSGLRDPARDLADLLTHPNQEDLLTPEAWQPFLKPYLAARRTADPELAERMHLYLAIFPVFWLAVLVRNGLQRAERGQLGGWMTNGLPANVRLRRYLARTLAWPDEHLDRQYAAVADVEFFPNQL